MTTRAALYVRISHDPTKSELGVTRQREDCEELIKSRGWDLVTQFEDNDVSAFDGSHRPGYGALMDAASRDEFDQIVVYAQSRLWRSDKERAEGIAALKAAEVGIAQVKGIDLNLANATGRLLANQMGAFDSFESEVKAERVARAAMQRAQSGRANGPVGYGWKRVKTFDEAGHLLSSVDVIDEEQAAVVRKIVVDLLSGRSMRSLTVEFNEAGIKTPRGQVGKWTHSTLTQLVRRAANVGDRVYNGTVVGTATWPPLISRDDHERVNALLSDPSRLMKRSGGRRHLLTFGIGECGVCGAGLTARSQRNGSVTYVCKEKDCVTRVIAPVDELVQALVIARLSQPDAVHLFDRDDQAGEQARQQADALRARLDNAADAYATGEIDRETLGRISTRLRPELEAAEKASQKRVEGLAPSLVASAVGEHAGAAWQGFDVSQRRALLTAMGVTVVLHKATRGRGFRPESVSVRWTEPAS